MEQKHSTVTTAAEDGAGSASEGGRTPVDWVAKPRRAVRGREAEPPGVAGRVPRTPPGAAAGGANGRRHRRALRARVRGRLDVGLPHAGDRRRKRDRAVHTERAHAGGARQQRPQLVRQRRDAGRTHGSTRRAHDLRGRGGRSAVTETAIRPEAWTPIERLNVREHGRRAMDRVGVVSPAKLMAGAQFVVAWGPRGDGRRGRGRAAHPQPGRARGRGPASGRDRTAPRRGDHDPQPRHRATCTKLPQVITRQEFVPLSVHVHLVC